MGRKPKKRVNGEGGVYKRKDGRWVRQYVDHTAVPPKYRYVYAKTQAKALQKCNEAMTKLGSGLAFDAGRTTLGEFLDRWIEDCVRDNVAPRTLDTYQLHAWRYIQPALGNKKLGKLEAVHVQTLVRSKLDEGLSPATVRYTLAVLRRALKQAKRWRLVEYNVSEDVDPPRLTKQEMRALSPEETRALLAVACGDRLEALYVLAVTVGLRQGELLGLKWEDVNFDAGTLKVDRQLQRMRDGSGLALIPTKTGKGRTVRLGASAVEALEAHRERQAEEKRSTHGLYRDQGFVFVTSIGTSLNPSNVVNRNFEPLLRRAGISNARFHDLRHTCASLLLSKGINPKIVQECLGHSSHAVTMDVCSHLMPDMQASAAEAMEDVLKDA